MLNPLYSATNDEEYGDQSQRLACAPNNQLLNCLVAIMVQFKPFIQCQQYNKGICNQLSYFEKMKSWDDLQTEAPP